tara:strand:+ start:1036 stop:2307 length:1272 start_codon:yes stop_codon:yes gene_type:complete
MISNHFLERYKIIFFEKLKKKGALFVFRKIIKKTLNLTNIFIYPFIFFICLIIKVISPLFLIRFGNLNSQKIGPFSSGPELSLCEKENGLQPNDSYDIYCSSNTNYACNEQLLKMWKRILRVHPVSKYFYNIMNLFSFGKEHLIKTSQNSRDIHGLLEKSPIHLSFLNEEIEQAKKDLNKMKINDQDKFVLLINRGQRFLDEGYPFDVNFEHNSFRNCSINDFMPTAEMLTKKGNFVIRVGHLVSDKIISKNSKIIDYDNNGFRTDLLDIYLASKCRYILGSDTGYLAVPGWNFRKPMVCVNFSQFERIGPWLSTWLFSFKKYWLKSEKRLMKIKEIISSGAGRFDRKNQYEKKGIELIDNTPEEILQITQEMESRLDGTWEKNEEDEILQKRFWQHFKLSKLHGVIRSRIGAHFLRANRDLI